MLTPPLPASPDISAKQAERRSATNTQTNSKFSNGLDLSAARKARDIADRLPLCHETNDSVPPSEAAKQELLRLSRSPFPAKIGVA